MVHINLHSDSTRKTVGQWDSWDSSHPPPNPKKPGYSAQIARWNRGYEHVRGDLSFHLVKVAPEQIL